MTVSADVLLSPDIEAKLSPRHTLPSHIYDGFYSTKDSSYKPGVQLGDIGKFQQTISEIL